MIRSKKEWICNKCSGKHIKWQGVCNFCGETATLEEFLLVRPKVQSNETIDARRLRRRSKNSERSIAKKMTAADGIDPNFERIASSTGRIGHITTIRVDAVSRTFMTENKNRKLPTWLIDAWILINQRGHHFNKDILLHVDPPNMPRNIPSDGVQIKLDTMAIVPLERFLEIVKKSKQLDIILDELFKKDVTIQDVLARYWSVQEQDVSSK